MIARECFSFNLNSKGRYLVSVCCRGFSSSNKYDVRVLTNGHPKNNISPTILSKIGRNLHLQQNHPLNIIKIKIEDYCNQYAQRHKQSAFIVFDNESPIVNTKSCFDDLLVLADHPSRNITDTYYVDDTTVLRTHTSAHQCELINAQHKAFLCSGDVYRRDEIDASHYPVFHQMEGVRVFDDEDYLAHGLTASSGEAQRKEVIERDLKSVLTGLATHLFGDVEMRWREDYFPFTAPSFELDVQFNGAWMEVLGCGVIHDQVMRNAGRPDKHGWAFGLGLERLAMTLFQIPDIRLFWSSDKRFSEQFSAGCIRPFKPYSKYPVCYKDVSFWLPQGSVLHPNDVYEVIRSVAGDTVEKVELFDEFVHPKTGRKSQAYRVNFRDMDRSLTNQEVDEVQLEVRKSLADKFHVELR